MEAFRMKSRNVQLERIQTGVRIERKMLKVLKALAEYMDVSLGELLEVIVLQSFEGGRGFSAGTLKRIAQLRKIYEMDYTLDQARMLLFVERQND
jgi:hypothetical protein